MAAVVGVAVEARGLVAGQTVRFTDIATSRTPIAAYGRVEEVRATEGRRALVADQGRAAPVAAVVERVQEVRPAVAPDAAYPEVVGAAPAQHEVGEQVGVLARPGPADPAATAAASEAYAPFPSVGQAAP